MWWTIGVFTAGVASVAWILWRLDVREMHRWTEECQEQWVKDNLDRDQEKGGTE